MSMLLMELISFEDGTGFLSSTFDFTGSKFGLLLTFGSTFGSTFGFEMIDVSLVLVGEVCGMVDG